VIKVASNSFHQWPEKKFKIDAQCNVISKQKYLAVSQTPLQKSKAKLTAFGSHKLHTCGKAAIPMVTST